MGPLILTKLSCFSALDGKTDYKIMINNLKAPSKSKDRKDVSLLLCVFVCCPPGSSHGLYPQHILVFVPLYGLDGDCDLDLMSITCAVTKSDIYLIPHFPGNA